jgi:hypothetical protein
VVRQLGLTKWSYISSMMAFTRPEASVAALWQ